MCVCLCACVVCTGVQARGQCPVSFSIILHLIYLRQDLSLNLGLASLTGLVGYPASSRDLPVSVPPPLSTGVIPAPQTLDFARILGI